MICQLMCGVLCKQSSVDATQTVKTLSGALDTQMTVNDFLAYSSFLSTWVSLAQTVTAWCSDVGFESADGHLGALKPSRFCTGLSRPGIPGRACELASLDRRSGSQRRPAFPGGMFPVFTLSQTTALVLFRGQHYTFTSAVMVIAPSVEVPLQVCFAYALQPHLHGLGMVPMCMLLRPAYLRWLGLAGIIICFHTHEACAVVFAAGWASPGKLVISIVLSPIK
jgi:hypothetical protein